MDSRLKAFERLLNVMDDLREKCPWDKKQTIETLRPLTIEETYELCDAIIDKDWKSIKEELGDIILHIVFYSKIADEKKQFNITNVLNDICEKLIHRHPHIYGDIKVTDEEEVKKNWEKLKLKEGKKSILDGVPDSLPALVKAGRIQEKVAQYGFEWSEIDQVWDKVNEEVGELKTAINSGNQINIEEEFGDVLFSLVNYARFINVNSENALAIVNKKFIERFKYIENKAKAHNKSIDKMSLEEMDKLWEESKEHY